MNLGVLLKFNQEVTAGMNSPSVTSLISHSRLLIWKKLANTCKAVKSRLWVDHVLVATGLCRCTFAIPMVISSNSLFGKSSSCSNQKGGGALHCRLMNDGMLTRLFRLHT